MDAPRPLREGTPMAEGDSPRDYHRMFGLLLTDYFTGWPLKVDIVRRGRGRLPGGLPDGLGPLAAHNLITFKSMHESLDAYAIRELIHHYVAYHKLVSPSTSDLLPEDRFRLYAVCARFPHNLSQQVPWHERQAGVYDCQWGTDTVRVIVVGLLPREVQNAPLHLFSASEEVAQFGQGAYGVRSERSSRLLHVLAAGFQGMSMMSFTLEDFDRWYAKKFFPHLTPKEQGEALALLSPEQRRELVRALPAEERLAGLPAEEIQRYLEQLKQPAQSAPRKPRRKA